MISILIMQAVGKIVSRWVSKNWICALCWGDGGCKTKSHRIPWCHKDLNWFHDIKRGNTIPKSLRGEKMWMLLIIHYCYESNPPRSFTMAAACTNVPWLFFSSHIYAQTLDSLPELLYRTPLIVAISNSLLSYSGGDFPLSP